jgi:hypothetical protein
LTFLEVSTGAENRANPLHQHAARAIVTRAARGRHQRFTHGDIQRIARLRPVQRNARKAILAVIDDSFGHLPASAHRALIRNAGR